MSDANYDVEGLYDDGEDDFSQALMEELWERRTEMTEMKAQIKLLRKERDEANGKITRMRDGYEGCCPLCETVGILNVKLLAERDAARQLACEFWVMDGSGYSSSSRAKEDALSRGWDCYKEK